LSFLGLVYSVSSARTFSSVNIKLSLVYRAAPFALLIFQAGQTEELLHLSVFPDSDDSKLIFTYRLSI